MANRVSTWFSSLSKVGRAGVLATSTLAVLTIAGASANPPTISTKTKVETASIPYTTTYQDDDSLLTTETKVITPGIKGSKQVTYQVTYTGDKETARKVIKEAVKTPPVAELDARGTKEVTTVTTTEAIPFDATSVKDTSMTSGTSKITTTGVAGVKSVTYQVTKIRGQEVSRNVVKETVTTPPVTQVTTVGTMVYCSNGSYVNAYGNTVCSPSSSASGATARCRDGSYSYSQSRSGTCSHHGGVAVWL